MTAGLDRREFLGGAAAAAAAGKEVRTGFIGVGSRGGSLLRETLAQADVTVKAVCDIDPQARDQALSLAARHQPQSFTEWKAVVDLKDVDAVFIGAPCDLHAEMAAACLEAGKYVYCEKPLGITPQQVDQVVRAARRSKAFLQIGQQLRYFPNMQEAVERIRDPQLVGRIYIIKAQRHSSRGRPAAGAPEPTAQQKARAAWYADVKRSGDQIVENSVHNIDICNWIAGSRPASAYGHGKKYFPSPIPAGTVMMDGFSVEYIYENDVHLDYSGLSFHARQLRQLPNGQWYVIFGEKGSVHLTHESATFYDLYGDGQPQDLLVKSKGLKVTDTAVQEFFACIREKRQPLADITVAATAALTAILGREAIYKRRSVTWKELGVAL